MDLGAYVNIGDDTIEEIVKRNNIDVPRLRGYRLMKDEEPIELQSYEEIVSEVVDELVHACPFWSSNPFASEYSWETKCKEKYYLNGGKVHWDRIHGWKRKVLKFAIKKEIKKRQENINTFNKYVGRDDVLYIHARIGGGNWPSYKDEVINQPWFIEKVDDCYDSTYCDIYARIR